jgi:excisionase family DNA binding protein
MLRYTAPVDYMTLVEMAEAIGVKSTTALRRLCEQGALRAEKKGKTWLVPIKEVERYKRERRRGRPPKEEHPA